MRLKKIGLVLTMLFVACQLSAQVKLSDKAEILVLTLGPAQTELYSAFGHSAIRVYDPENKIDRIYNYGVFDFNQPNFYLNFARGFLNYKLDTVDYPRFKYVYMYYNRSIHEQVLNFNQEEKQQFYDFLEWNMLPENQYYYYDYFYDNCATRIRDALVNVFKNKIEFDGSYIETDYTIRQLTDLYLKEQPWGDLGIDLCLGLPMDVSATPYMYMYLPDYIESGLNNAKIIRDGVASPLVRKTLVTYESKSENTSDNSLFTPQKIFWTLFVIVAILSYVQYGKQKTFNRLDATLFIIIGLLGTFLFLLWTVTDHHAAASNMNILWAFPLHLITGILLMKKSTPKWVNKYFLLTSFFMAALVLFWMFLPQMLHYSLIPIVLILGLRGFMIWKMSSKN